MGDLNLFVKNLVSKVSKKVGDSPRGGGKYDDVCPRMVFHYGFPSGATSLAYVSLQNILAVSTNDGCIKLFGGENKQVLLESPTRSRCKLMQFLDNHGVLLVVTIENNIQIWDIDKKIMCHVYDLEEEITSFAFIQQSSFVYIGDDHGNISVLEMDGETFELKKMKYSIPFAASGGVIHGTSSHREVVYIMPQPMAENKRVLIIFGDGLIILWGLSESKMLAVRGNNVLKSHGQEENKKIITAACWACPQGSKLVAGYNNGEVLFWGIPTISEQSRKSHKEDSSSQSLPLSKLNLGFKMYKIPITSLRWVMQEKDSLLYVNGVSNQSSSSFHFQVIFLKDNNESRTVKLELPLSKACTDVAIISNKESKKSKYSMLLLLLESGHLCAYDNSEIEKYLAHPQSKSPSLPMQIMVKLPYLDASITAAKLIANCSNDSNYLSEDHTHVDSLPSVLPLDSEAKERTVFHGPQKLTLSMIRKLYITGHNDGSIFFWDTTCSLLLPLFSLRQQNDDSKDLGSSAITALEFDIPSMLLVTGDQLGVVRIMTLKADDFKEIVHSKHGGNKIIDDIRVINTHTSAVTSFSIDYSSKRLAVGCAGGYVSIIDIKGPKLLAKRHFPSEVPCGVFSLQFAGYGLPGSEKKFLFLALDDASLVALDGETGDTISSKRIGPKNPSKVLFMQIVDVVESSVKPAALPNHPDQNEGSNNRSLKHSLLLLCSERSVHVYSSTHIVEGIKKAHSKARLHNTCCCASTFYIAASHLGLILLYNDGKVEVRSLPDLEILKESTIQGLTIPNFRSKPNFGYSLCCSYEGDLALLMRDQEIFFVSVLPQKHVCKLLGSIISVYERNLMPSYQNSSPVKAKKMGIFAMAIKDLKGKKDTPDGGNGDAIFNGRDQDLRVIFSIANFPLPSDTSDKLNGNEISKDVDIDDIDVDDFNDTGHHDSNLPKMNLNGKLQALKAKLKPKKGKHTDAASEEHRAGEHTNNVDQIKKRYGYSNAGGSGDPKLAVSKLSENLKKLQGIDTKTSQMQESAQNFSTLSQALLEKTEKGRRSL